MRSFLNLKIGVKLMVSFFILAIITGLVGIVGIINLNTLNQSDTELYEDMTVPISELGDMTTSFQEMSVDMRNMIIENRPDLIQANIGKYLIQKQEIETSAASLEKSVKDPEMKTAYDAFITSQKAVADQFEKVQALALQNQDAEAFAMLSANGPLVAVAAAEVNALNKMTKIKLDTAKAKEDANTAQGNSAAIFMGIFTGIAFILAIAFGLILRTMIANPLAKANLMIKEMSIGRFTMRLNMNRKDEIGEMAQSMDTFSNEIQTVIIGTMNQISNGDVSATVEPWDSQDELTPALKQIVETIRGLVAEATMLSTAAVEGQLDKRGNIDAFNGGYKEIIQGVNDTLDAVVGPVHVAADYVEKIGQGQIPAKITETYYGDFDTLKNSINACIDGLGALTEGNRILGKMSLNDYSETIDGTYSGIYGEIALAINAVHTRLDRVVAISTHIADGDMTDLDILKQIGRRSNNDTLIPSLIQMIENINNLVKETDDMTIIAVAGDLRNRGDASKFQGEFAKVIEGFNQTLDAVIQPLIEASDTLNEFSTGNLSTAMVGNYRGDHAQIKNALNNTIAFLKHYVDEITNTLEEMGQGNFNQEITTEYLGDFQAIKNALNNITTNLSTTMADINIAAGQVEIGSQQISDGGQALSQGTTEQASSIEELTASIEEVAGETKKNAVNANQANELANTVRSLAVAGNDQMGDMVTAMVEINVSSKRISKIIKVIDDIAFQTNILALNAAVEAARAGQHGKGFAVVAKEVRSLAARSAEAAKETTGLIEGSIAKVNVGSKIADQTAESLKDILNQIEKVTTLVGNIAQASNDQAAEIAQINQGIEQVSQVVQTNSATAEESAAASEELSGQAEMLRQMVGAFKLKSAGQIDGVVKAAIQNSVTLSEPQIILDTLDKY
ncbi:HAMP domain-containing protein [Acetobacterium paludosum]|uniref:HAMP domain-containing protein n=1 Tax=Acetobacterium paludosum TaxID=52693 RepID=A0A923HXR8_9FIRM|nr:methyl-accepting chemotaxis protein [Acetobacterium paludosum]MBC3888579.1 HAMP domain-containing protein [Acetobacterium paludosum]